MLLNIPHKYVAPQPKVYMSELYFYATNMLQLNQLNPWCRRVTNTKKNTSDIQDYLILMENYLETVLYPIQLRGDL
jgi:hypothetical protein